MSISDKELQEAFRRSQLVQKQNDLTTQKANARVRANVLGHNKARANGSDTERMFLSLIHI